MVKSIWIQLLAVVLLAGTNSQLMVALVAQEPEKALRELFVPFEELGPATPIFPRNV